MFGHSQSTDDNQQIPDQSIDAALNSVSESTGVNHNQSTVASGSEWQHPGEPITAPPSQPVATSSTPNDLISIKQQALSNLKPLVQHLNQSPEEKFHVTMMMIHASDDQSLVSQAYEDAQKIKDEAKRAQALLDVVNEINYFNSQEP